MQFLVCNVDSKEVLGSDRTFARIWCVLQSFNIGLLCSLCFDVLCSELRQCIKLLTAELVMQQRPRLLGKICSTIRAFLSQLRSLPTPCHYVLVVSCRFCVLVYFSESDATVEALIQNFHSEYGRSEYQPSCTIVSSRLYSAPKHFGPASGLGLALDLRVGLLSIEDSEGAWPENWSARLRTAGVAMHPLLELYY